VLKIARFSNLMEKRAEIMPILHNKQAIFACLACNLTGFYTFEHAISHWTSIFNTLLMSFTS